jgi:hypothetical protein
MAAMAGEIKAASPFVGSARRGIIRRLARPLVAGSSPEGTMPDPRSVMQEFRTLDAKRLAKGLSSEEERRFAELRDLVGGEPGAGTPRSGFDVTAAAARLRESLLPAGLRNRPPPPPELSPEPEPEPFFPAPAPAALADAAPEAPLFADADAAALFDPATLGWEGDEAAAQPTGDPAAQEVAAWDASAGWDPSAAGGQGWDSSALPADAAAWDPAAVPMDASGQPWDPAALPPDPGAQPWDSNGQASDPNALALDANGQVWDPNAVAWDAGAAGGEPAAYDSGLAAEPIDLSNTWDPASLAAQDAASTDAGVSALDGAWDPVLSAELEPEPTRALELAGAPVTAPGELSALDLDAGAFELEPIDGAAPIADDGGVSAPAADPTPAGWPPTLDAISDGFAFDEAATPTEPTEMLGLANEPEPTQALPLLAPDPASLVPDGWDPVPAPAIAVPGAAFGAYDELAAGGANLASGDGLDIGGLEAGLDATLARDPSSPPGTPAAELGEYDDTAGFAPGAVFEPPPDGPFETGAPPVLGADASPVLDGTVGWPADGALDPSFALASGGSFDAAADAASGWTTAEAPAPWETAPANAALEPLSLEVPALALDPDPVSQSHPLTAVSPQAAPSGEDDFALPEIVEEIPTVDGEEILEEIPADEAAFLPPLDFPAAPVPPAPPSPDPAAALAPAAPIPPAVASPPAPTARPAPPAPPATATAAGAHRVVVHTLEGTVKRGVIEDVDLAATALALAPAKGEAAESIATEKVKAIFFMLAPGETPPAALGKKVRVTFRDGRQVAGYSADYREEGIGFFMIPGDTRTNTGRIWVYRAAVKQVVVS